jgi:hypothetical protein
MKLRRARRVLAGWLVVSVVPHAAVAQLSNEQKVKCANAYEQAQRTRNEGLFRASRDQLLVCAQDLCPPVLRNECVKWLGEIDAAMPTVLIVALDGAGNEISDVAVTVDGTKVLDRLNGQALPVDPGVHTFRFSRAGSDTIEQKVLIREAEKRRPVSVTFAANASIAPEKPATPSDGSSVPAGTWILGGVGVVAIGLSIPMYLSAQKSRSDLEARCGDRGVCDPSEGDSLQRKFLYGDIALGVGVIALASATILWIAAPKKTVTAGVAPMPGGVAGAFSVAF